jgi:hypothetical protein
MLGDGLASMIDYGNSFRCHHTARIPRSNRSREAMRGAGELGDRRDTREMPV